MKVRTVVCDFETFSACDLRAAGAARYAEDPTTEVLSLTYTEIGHAPNLWAPGADTAPLAELAAADDTIFVAHNAFFEKCIWRAIMVQKFSLPDIPDKRWHCTQAACAMRGLPQDLDRALMVLRLPHQKDKDGSKLVKQMSKPDRKGNYTLVRDPAALSRVYQYNASDIDSTVGLHQRLGWLPQGERQVWLFDQLMNQRGVMLDMDFVAKAQAVVDRGSAPLFREFAELTGGLKPSQGAKFLAWLHEQGVHLDNLKKETVAEILGEDDDDELDELSDDGTAVGVDLVLPPMALRALEIRALVGSASIKKLARMAKCVGEDGRARGLLQYHGAGPGLWAGRLFQPQNFPRGGIQIAGKDGKRRAPPPQLVVDAIMSGDPEFVEMSLGIPPVEAVVGALRHAIVAKPGHLIVAGDFAGIQARTVLALAGQHDKTALMASGANVYCDMAQQIYKRPISKEDTEEYVIGKGAVLGLGFQMGALKFLSRMAKGHAFEFAEDVVRVYRKEWAPMVPKVWYALDDAAVAAVHDRRPQEAYGIEYRLQDGWLTARLPSGRLLWYFNPMAKTKAMPWDETDVRLAWSSQAMKFGRWVTRDMFGGLLTENVVMGIQRDLLVCAMLKCEREGLPVILNVHDEIILEVPENRADPKVLTEIMQDIPQWAKDLQIPVSVESWAGTRYRK